MSDGIRLESELVKSLERLDEILNKAQIQSGSGNEPGSWAGGDTEEYDSEKDAKWDDDIDGNGTDYKGKKVKKGMPPEMAAKMQAAQGGEEEEEEEEDRPPRRAEEEEEQFGKSQSRRHGVEVSEFLSELTKAVAIHCAELEDYVVKSVQSLHAENGEIVKALAENLSVLDEHITKSHDNIVQYADGPARGPKSMLDMSKSVEGQSNGFDKATALQLLEKGVEAGSVSPLDVIKCEQYGPQAIDQNLLKSLSA